MMMMMMILITSGQTNLTTGRIADAHGRFNIIRKVAPPVWPNTCFLGLARVQIPNDISIGSAVFAQLAADSRYTLYTTHHLFPLEIAPTHAWRTSTPSNI